MFEHLAPFRVVIVTGPARSGTTICAHMIAADTGKRLYDDCKDSLTVQRVRELIAQAESKVIQCPLLAQYADDFGAEQDVAVVIMRRSAADITASNDRMQKRSPMRLDGQSQAAAVYATWETQRERIAHPFEVEYESLNAHPLWIAPGLRIAPYWGNKTWRLPEMTR
jgi:hypothetical protein